MQPAYAIHDDIGTYVGTIIPQDSNVRIFETGGFDMCRQYTVNYDEKDQGDVITKLIKQMI